jgi:ATP-dependent helicase HrpB
MKPLFPIHDVIPALKVQLEKSPVVILQAPPGAGKSTILPLELLDENWLNGKKMIMLEPRRLAARSVASRMADLLDEETGNTVGYRVRFDTKISKSTRIEVVTEGILTRMLQNDNALDHLGLVIFDEFHERSLNADLALALCTEVQQVLRPDLKILIMSATLEGKRLSELLENAPVISSEGRQFPVSYMYTERDEKEFLHISMAKVIRRAVKEQQGDVLAFLPGAAEIQRTQEMLENEFPAFRILPLYGDLSTQKQQEAISPSVKGQRKIVLATSIAETSLTIEGITTVVDSGLSRVPRFDPRSGLTKLETVKVTRDAADQRAGRAGRLGPGVCYRLWNQHQQSQLNPTRKPEILEADLAPLMLELSEWGIRDINELRWLDPPPNGAAGQARDLLEQLEAIQHGKITQRGKKMLLFPTHPRIAHLLIEGLEWDSREPERNFAALAADIAALLEERDPLQKEAGIDLSLRIEALRKWRKGEFVVADRRILERIERLSLSWRKLLKVNADNKAPDTYGTGKLIAAAYPERVAKRTGSRYRLANGRFAKMQETDALHREEYIAVAQLDGGSNEGRIYSAAALDPGDLADLATEKEKLHWDKERGMVAGALEKSIGSIVLQSRVITKIDKEEKAKIICAELKAQGLQFLGWGEAQTDLQNRILSLRKWRPLEAWPDLSSEKLLEEPEKWLGPYLDSITKQTELQKLDLNQVLLSVLPWELSQKLDRLAPARLEVPTGSMIRLNYFPDGSKVEMAVRLQEIFGMLETPTLNEGKVKVLMHLLSPGYKPVQVTQDLNSFWNKTYFEVRKELMGRYPKHHWPTDPLTADPVRGAKRRK